MSFIIEEESTAWLTVSFTGRDGEDVSPSSIRYRIDSAGGNVKDWTFVSSGQEIEIEITSEDNQMTIDRIFEPRTVTVEATIGSSQKQNREFYYTLKNLRYIP